MTFGDELIEPFPFFYLDEIAKVRKGVVRERSTARFFVDGDPVEVTVYAGEKLQGDLVRAAVGVEFDPFDDLKKLS